MTAFEQVVPGSASGRAGARRTVLDPSSVVCAIVPHFECEPWLGQALESLLDQTRPPDAIVVVDDGSTRPPTDIVRRYPGVTLLEAADNGGPYRLVQAVIDRVGADAFLFQDADDWSANDRLEVLLEVAEATGAELVGSHEVRMIVDEHQVLPVRYPLDVNAALAEHPTAFPLLHPTSVIARGLVERLGGFATAMRFSGDEELLRRAAHVARVVNADHFGYFRRKRAGSLTTTADTALRSPARLAVQATLADRARRNADAVADGGRPDLRPWRTAPAPRLRHVTGPPIDAQPARTSPSERRRRQHVMSVGRVPDPSPNFPSPIFVVGAPRSGHEQLGWALAQHPALRFVPDATWLATLAGDVLRTTCDSRPWVPADLSSRMAATLLELASPRHRPVAAGSALLRRAGTLATLWPGARFVHVVRDPDEVAASLAMSPVDEGTFHSPDLAYSRWFDAVELGLRLERALGSHRLLRVAHEQFVGDPDGVIGALTAFVGAAPDAASTGGCRRTLSAFADSESVRERPTAVNPPGGASTWLVERARHRWHTLDEPATPADWVDDRHADGDRALAELVEVSIGDDRRSGATSGRLVDGFRQLVSAAVPPGAIVAVISRGDTELLQLDGRAGRHFPCEESGVYLGYHPADSDALLAHLDAHRGRGATHLALPATALWWIDHYDGLRDHLARRCRLVAYVEDVGAVWDLGRPPEVDATNGAITALVRSAA